MNWLKIIEFVEAWAAARELPADLKGRTLALVEFASEPDCQFFYPGRTELAHRAFISALTRWARARRARTETVTLTPDHYREWLVAEQRTDSEETRGEFIESRYRLTPE